MGWFGVLAESSKPEDRFLVRECHLNWWALPAALPGRRLFYLDIGLQLTASPTKPLTAFTLALPFDAEKIKWSGKDLTWAQDLHEIIRKDDISSQVFGGPVTVVGNSTAGYTLEFRDGERWDLASVKVSGITLAAGAESNRRDLSLWSVPLTDEIAAGETRYVRLRWSVFRTGNIWRWRRQWLSNSGVEVDFRVADVREALREEHEREYWARVVPIEQVNLFLIAPPRLRARVASPALHYVRILEEGQWRDYLQGTRYFRPVRGMLVYYWRYPLRRGQATAPLLAQPSEPGGGSTSEREHDTARPQGPLAITIDEPFRVFLGLNREGPAAGPGLLLRNVVSLVIALAIYANLPHVSAHLHGIDVHPAATLKWIFGGSVAAVLGAVSLYAALIRGKLRSLRLLLRRLERAALRPFSGR